MAVVGVQNVGMSALPLTRHPGAPSGVAAVEVQAARPARGVLALTFRVADPEAALVLPPRGVTPERRDGLWRRTCFEAFVATPGAEGYHELNLSPSLDWAAYRFDGYRAGMAPAQVPPPRILAGSLDGGFELSAIVDLSELPGLSAAPWRLGLSSVIADIEGRLSYWALAHPPGDPDFHHAGGFVLEMS